MDDLNLSDLRNKILTSLLNTCPENIYKYLEEDDARTKEIDKLKNCVKNYCKMELHDEASKKAIQAIEEESECDDWISLKIEYESKLKQSYNQPANFNKHLYMKKLENQIKIAQSRQTQRQEQDSDFAITETTETYIDPFSKKPIRNPMRNKICNHVYETETIERVVRNKKNKGCPYMGCPNKQPLQTQHLDQDEELLLTIQRTQQSNHSSQDDE